jgi:hypothetical protein
VNSDSSESKDQEQSLSPWKSFKKKNPNWQPGAKKTDNNITETISNKKIFVSIPAFNEEDLKNTVIDCFKKADNPDNIFIGICNQRSDNIFEDFSSFKNVKVVNLGTDLLMGLGLSFFISCSLAEDQDFFLRIDGHSRFETGWDSILKRNYEIIKNRENKKVIISYRSPWFEKLKDNSIKYHTFSKPDVETLKRENLSAIKKIENLKKDEKEWNELGYIEHYFVSGHMIFSSIDFLKDIFPDPRIIFFGEEHTIPIRAYTNGYRMYAIKEQSIFHMGKTSEYYENLGLDNWKLLNTNQQLKQSFLWRTFQFFYRKVLKGEEFGYYSAKNLESYEEYLQNMGYDYRDIIE